MVNCAIQIEIEVCKNACLFCKPEGFKVSDKKVVLVVSRHIYKQAINLRKKGFNEVELSGHDPIEFEHIIGFMSWLEKIGFQKIILLTHGRNLADISFAKKIMELKSLMLKIALYGSNPKIHDSVTNSKGSFDETLQGIRNVQLLRPNIIFEFHTLIMKENKDDIENIIDLFADLNPSNVIIRMPYIPVHNFAQKSAVSYSEIKPIIKKIFTRCKEKLKGGFAFAGIPYCIFGFIDNHIVEDNVPPMADNYSVPKVHETEMHGVPKYRLRKKLGICKECIYTNSCSGFIKDYVERFNMEQDSTLKPL